MTVITKKNKTKSPKPSQITLQRFKYLKSSIIDSYLSLDYKSQSETMFTLAINFNRILSKKNIKTFKLGKSNGTCKGFQDLLTSYSKRNRLYIIKKNNGPRNLYIFFREDVLYLLQNKKNLDTPKNILGFLAPKVKTIALRNELDNSNIYIILLNCKLKLYKKALLKFYKTSQHKPVFITQGDTDLALCFINKESYNSTYKELNDNSQYDFEYFNSLLADNCDNIDYIMENYSKIHSKRLSK